MGFRTSCILSSPRRTCNFRAGPPYDVAMMVTLLLYAYCVGVLSSRKIAAACERNVAFMAIVGHQRPDFRTISDFREIHIEPLSELFVEVLRLAGELGMVKLGNLALDGSKEQMAHKLRTPSGRACYAKRKHIVEPVFGRIKHARGFRQFLLRGLKNVGAEWKLLCLSPPVTMQSLWGAGMCP